MFEKLKALEDKFNEINEKLMQPETINNTSLYTSLMKEYKTLTPIVEKFGEYKKAKAANDEAIELLDAGGMDKDFKEMVQMQLEESKEDMAKLEEELKLLLLPKGPNDERNVIIEIRGGAGGEEAALFAGSLYRMYSMYAASKGWTIEVMNANETELGGYKEITFSVSGEGAYSRLKYESGVHRVQRVPETESQGRVHTSTVTVAVLPEADEVELDLNEEKDLKIDVFRSSGAGGQYAKTGSLRDEAFGGWFYMDPERGMQTGWVLIDGVWYYFHPVSDGRRGIMYAGQKTPDGYYVDEKGAWDGKEK